MPTTQGLGADFRQADMVELAFLHQLGQRADGLFNSNIRVESSGLEQVDLLRAPEDGNTLINGVADLLSPAEWHCGQDRLTTDIDSRHTVPEGVPKILPSRPR